MTPFKNPVSSFLPSLGVVIILALAEVFRTGTRLDEDQSLTI
jgi:hypothetical protein